MRRIKQTKKIQDIKIFIALEDKKSSRFYFNDLIKDKKILAHVKVIPHQKCTDPKHVLSTAEEYIEKTNIAQYDRAWIVVDKDSFTADNFKSIFEKARESKFCIAYSNECYELWLLLHFKDIYNFKNRQNIIKELNFEFKKAFGKEYDKASHNVYVMVKDRQTKAIERAKEIIKRIEQNEGEVNPYNNNPSTFLHLLIECLNKLSMDISHNIEDCKYPKVVFFK